MSAELPDQRFQIGKGCIHLRLFISNYGTRAIRLSQGCSPIACCLSMVMYIPQQASKLSSRALWVFRPIVLFKHPNVSCLQSSMLHGHRYLRSRYRENSQQFREIYHALTKRTPYQPIPFLIPIQVIILQVNIFYIRGYPAKKSLGSSAVASGLPVSRLIPNLSDLMVSHSQSSSSEAKS